MRIVIDASAILALLKGEPGAVRAGEMIGEAFVSTVNLAEVAGVLNRGGSSLEVVKSIIGGLPCVPIAPDLPTALEAGLMQSMTRHLGLSLGDRFCLALAKQIDALVVTADRQWDRIPDDIGVKVELVR